MLLACLGIVLTVAVACVAPPTPVPAAATPSNTITDIVWQWTSVTTKPTGETTTVADPQNYTITFRDDGTLSGKADCNNFTGTYSQEGGFTITLGASTMAACGESSLDQQYLELLSAVVAGGLHGQGNLALEMPAAKSVCLFCERAGGDRQPHACPAPSSDITDIVWKRQTLEDVAAGASTRVPDPSKYTIVFRTDGTTTGQADCNTFSGTDSQANGFTMSVTPDVMAACDQGSMDQQFLNLLDAVAAGGPDGAGGLMLQTAGGAQKLLLATAALRQRNRVMR